jgi:mRNA interferase RelE/StbE
VASYEIEFKKSVSKDVRSIPSADLRRILSRIDALRDDPRPPGCVKLAGEEYYRIRQGDYRIVYAIEDGRLLVIVIRIGDRKEIYR